MLMLNLVFDLGDSLFLSRENMSARHLRLELDSGVSVASVAPKVGDLPHPGPTPGATR